jgi:hypothetical protein
MKVNQRNSGCEAWFIALREEHRLSVFEKRILGRTFQFKSQEETGGMKNSKMRIFIIRTFHKILLGRPDQEE